MNINVSKLISLILLTAECLSWTFAYEIPPVMLEAFSPKGLRVSIPDSPGMKLFAFHGNINSPIDMEPGEIVIEILYAKNGNWSYCEPSVELHVGDIIHYWTHVQEAEGAHTKPAQQYTIRELKPGSDCFDTSTSNRDNIVFKEDSNLLFGDKFDNNEIDLSKWTIEQRIPTYVGPDYEFNSYINNKETIFIKNSILHLKPVPLQKEADVRGVLNLMQGCTGGRKSTIECYYEQKSSFLLPPVRSARIISKFSFKYGKIEIRCKLPAGDWIYPQVLLESPGDNYENIWIAYSRGNDRLIGTDVNDVGSRLLFGGPVFEAREPKRSVFLRSEKSNIPYNQNFHVFGAEWRPEKIVLTIDNRTYGTINTEELVASNVGRPLNKNLRIALGVGVGGITHFPEGFKSNNNEKPWRSDNRDMLVDFFNSRNAWSSTWRGDDSALQIDYIKVWSL